MKRLVLVGPGIEISHGHDFHHACTIAQECARRCIPLDVLASHKVDADVSSELTCQTAFRIGVYDRPRFKHPINSVAAYISWSRLYREDFAAALDGQIGADDLLLVNTITISGLAGLAGWLASKPAEKRPATAVILRFGAEEGLPRSRSALPRVSRALYRRVLDRLHRLLGPRLLLAADTRLIGEDFEHLIGRPVARIPFPISVPEPVPPRPGPRPAHLLFLTSSTSEKGFHLLPDALATAFTASPDLSATVRVVNPRKSYAPLVERLRAMAPRVRILDGALDNASYYDALSQTDAVLLPYDPRVFAKRSSQILAEAASSGRAVIVPAGSFLDHERLTTGIVGMPIEAFTSEALAEAIGRFVADKDRLITAAWAACPDQRKRHGVTAFVDRLVEFAATANRADVRSEGAREIDVGHLGIRLE